MSLTPIYGLIISATLFTSGIIVILIKRNAIFVLMGVELILNAANLNFVIFSKNDPLIQGQIMAVFSIVLAAAEASIALALLLLIYRKYQSSDLDNLDELKY